VTRGAMLSTRKQRSIAESWRAQAPSLFDDPAFRQGIMLASLAAQFLGSEHSQTHAREQRTARIYG